MNYKAIVIGTSAGGMNALKAILPSLPAGYKIPIVIVQHIGVSSENFWIEMLNSLCALTVKEADEKEKIKQGSVYIAPPNYHLLIEEDETFSLSTDHKVNYARPSIDVLFESGAHSYREKLIGVILTGSNNDGSKGLKRIKESGGLTIVEDPQTAESQAMPAYAIANTRTDYILPLAKITDLLIELDKKN